MCEHFHYTTKGSYTLIDWFLSNQEGSFVVCTCRSIGLPYYYSMLVTVTWIINMELALWSVPCYLFCLTSLGNSSVLYWNPHFWTLNKLFFQFIFVIIVCRNTFWSFYSKMWNNCSMALHENASSPKYHKKLTSPTIYHLFSV